MTYTTTHPWLTFRADLAKIPYTFWMHLGEIKSKCDHIAGVPLRPDSARKMHTVYLAKGVIATTAIEGNTLREEDAIKMLEGKLELPPSQQYLQQEVTNIITACDWITAQIHAGNTPKISVETLKYFNHLVLDKLSLPDGGVSGEVRKHKVGVGRYLAPMPEECEFLLQKLCDWLDTDFPSDNHVFAFLKAIIAHLYIAWIHPFDDGNGRTARLVEFLILESAGIAQPACHLLSNHYNLTRGEYYRQLDHASKSGGDILPFLQYAAQGFVDGLKEQLLEIRAMQWDITWRNYISESFHDQQSQACLRRRSLALDLGRIQGAVPLVKLLDLTPGLAKAYANKTLRTVQRDVEELEKMKLVSRGPDGVQANKDVIYAFLPWRAKAS